MIDLKRDQSEKGIDPLQIGSKVQTIRSDLDYSPIRFSLSSLELVKKTDCFNKIKLKNRITNWKGLYWSKIYFCIYSQCIYTYGHRLAAMHLLYRSHCLLSSLKLDECTSFWTTFWGPESKNKYRRPKTAIRGYPGGEKGLYLKMVHSSMGPNFSNIRLISSSDCDFESIPTKSFRSSSLFELPSIFSIWFSIFMPPILKIRYQKQKLVEWNRSVEAHSDP